MKPSKTAKREARSAGPRFQLTTGTAAIVLALLVALFFHDVFLGGKTFVSPDTTEPAGFARVGEQSLYHDHVYPLWNPYVFLGMPSFGSGAYNPLIYPPDWPLALLGKIVPLPDMIWMLIYYFLGGLFFFLLAREWGARPEASLIAGAAFVFAPNLVAVGSHGHGSQLVDSAYLPLMLWLAARWLRRGTLMELGWLALAGGFQMLRGHVQICFYTWMAIGLLATVQLAVPARPPLALGWRFGRAAALGAAAALAFGVAAFYNMPLSDYARWSIRGAGEGGGAGMAYATQWSLAPYELPSLVIPGWAGFGGETYWGGMPFTDYPNAFLGIVAVLLALPAFLRPGRMPRFAAIFAGVLALFSLLVAFGSNFPLYAFLYAHLPLFNKFRIPVMVLVLLQVAAGLALAWGWSAVLDAAQESAPPPRLRRGFVVAAAVLAIAGLVALTGGGAFHAGYVGLATHARAQYPAELAELAFRFFVGDLGRAALLGLATVGLAWLALGRKLPAVIASAGVLALLLVELLPVSGRVMAPVIGEMTARNLEAGRDDVVEFLEKAGPLEDFRILPLAEIRSNRFAGFRIASIGGYHAAKPKRFQEVMDAGLPSSLGWLRLLNVRFIVSPQPLEPAPPELREVFHGSQYVYENLLALPRATLVDRYRVVSPDRAIVDSVRAMSVDAADFAYLEEDPGFPQGTRGAASARIVRYRLNEVEVEAEAQGPALLRLADLWYPDWSATLDGKPARILRADYLMRGVVVPGGRHRVIFEFHSAAMGRGWMVSLISAALAVAAIVWGWFLNRRGTDAGASA